jgi:hypothetical protein
MAPVVMGWGHNREEHYTFVYKGKIFFSRTNAPEKCNFK